jgi:hypothetical protein
MHKKYRDMSADEVREYNARWREANREKAATYSRRWRENNKDKKRADAREYYKNNTLVIKERSLAYRQKNADKLRAKGAAFREANRLKLRDASRRRIGIMDAHRFDELWRLQCGVCAICRTSDFGKQGPCGDHDHATGLMRGVLCSVCNLALGLFRDSPERLLSAVTYLQKISQE